MKLATSIVAIGLALAGALSAAQAQTRVFVAAQGADTNPCTFAQPCRSFQQAHNTVAAGGEIDVLDPAGYGALTITKAISIQGHGYSGISVASSGTGITVNAGAPDKINLNGLIIDGAGAGSNGIQFNTGQSLTVENCVVRFMVHDGIDFNTTTATSTLTVSNSLTTDNGGDGIFLAPTGSATGVFNSVVANNNGANGIQVYGGLSAGTNTINATASDSVVAGNVIGFAAQATAGSASTSLMVSHSVAANNGLANNGYGVYANNAGATLRLANSTVTGNNTGWNASNGGVVASYGDNYIDGNGGNMGSLTPINRQ